MSNTPTSAEIEETFERFITFGNLFDEKTRRYIVQYIHSKIFHTPLPESSLTQDKYINYLTTSLDSILSHEPIQKAVSESDGLTQQLIHDVLRWLKKTDQKIKEDNPYYEEKQRFDAWSHKPTFLWKDSWYNCTNYLKNIYQEQELAIGFYVKKLKELMPSAPSTIQEQELADQLKEKTALDIVIDDLLAQWDALLTAKILKYELEQIDRERELFCELLYAKVEEFLKLISIISPFALETGRFWDMSRGLWKDVSFDVLDRYEQLLANEQSIQELADMLGKMREAEIETEEEIFDEVIVKKEWVADELAKSEIKGIHTSNHLNTLLPSEVALLGDQSTELAFFQKYADQNLLSFKYEGRKMVSSSTVNHVHHEKKKRKEKGPFIMCIDTSGSMHGLPSQIAKVLAFAIMKIAAAERRKCYLISFSIGIKAISLHDLANSMDKIVDFLSMSFDGGTDVTPALSEALTMLQTNDYREADVLMISDFVMFEIRKEILQRINREQQKETQFHSLTIGNKANPEVVDAFDNCWVYDPAERGVFKQMNQDLQQLRNT
ncbi:MAG: VWA domain-containing protein [Flammeovirgaceae bacterium]